MGENNFAAGPVVLYGVILLMSGVAYSILVQMLIRLHGKSSTIATAIGSDRKGKMSVAIYACAIVLCFINSWIGLALYAFVAAMWIIPDKRIEKRLMQHADEK